MLDPKTHQLLCEQIVVEEILGKSTFQLMDFPDKHFAVAGLLLRPNIKHQSLVIS